MSRRKAHQPQGGPIEPDEDVKLGPIERFTLWLFGLFGPSKPTAFRPLVFVRPADEEETGER